MPVPVKFIGDKSPFVRDKLLSPPVMAMDIARLVPEIEIKSELNVRALAPMLPALNDAPSPPLGPEMPPLLKVPDRRFVRPPIATGKVIVKPPVKQH